MAIDIAAGPDVDIVYGNEAAATYGTVATTFTKVFGLDTKLSLNVDKNLGEYGDIGSRRLQYFKSKKFDGSFDIDFIMSNANFWDLVFNDGVGTALDPFTWEAYGNLLSFSTKINDRKEAKQWAVLGMAVNELGLEFARGEPIKTKLSGLFANFGAKTSSVARSTLTLGGLDDAFTFAGGELKIAAADNYVGLIAKGSLKIGNDLKGFGDIGVEVLQKIKGLKAIGGLTLGVKHASGATKYPVDMARAASTDGQNLAMSIVITDGTRSITMALTGCWMKSFSTGYEAFEEIDENLVIVFSDITVELAGFT